jgi:hypothetical protein
MHNEQQQHHLKPNNNIILKLAFIVLSIVLLTGISLVPALQECSVWTITTTSTSPAEPGWSEPSNKTDCTSI